LVAASDHPPGFTLINVFLDLSTEYVHDNPGVIKLLFETPSGFAMFAIDEMYLKKHIEVHYLICSFFLRC
jgi:hypothetical protein